MNKLGIAQTIKITLISAFVLTEGVLFALFLVEDFGEAYVGMNVWLKYSTVLLAFLFSIVHFVYWGTEGRNLFDAMLLSLGLALTLVSDLFLLVRGDHYEVALVTFTGAQLCYFARICRTKLWLIISIALRVALPIVAIAVLASMGEANALFVLVAIYFVQLVVNFAESVAAAVMAKDRAERAKYIVLSVGFALFIGCDICVGLTNLYDGMANELIWLFYTPSQVLIALSHRRIYETETD